MHEVARKRSYLKRFSKAITVASTFFAERAELYCVTTTTLSRCIMTISFEADGFSRIAYRMPFGVMCDVSI